MINFKTILQQCIKFGDSAEDIRKKTTMVTIDILDNMLDSNDKIDSIINIMNQLKDEIEKTNNECRLLVKNNFDKYNIIKEKSAWIERIYQKELDLPDKRQLKFNELHIIVLLILTIFMSTIIIISGAPIIIGIGLFLGAASVEVYKTHIEKKLNNALLTLEKQSIEKDLKKAELEKIEIDSLRRGVSANKFLMEYNLDVKESLETALKVIEQRLILEKAKRFVEDNENCFVEDNEKGKAKVIKRP